MSRTIIINEAQLSLIEKLVKETTTLMNNGTTKEYGNASQIGTSATIHTTDGKPIPGKEVYSDEKAKTAAFDGYFGNPGRKVQQ